jgi:hypothetical protein
LIISNFQPSAISIIKGHGARVTQAIPLAAPAATERRLGGLSFWRSGQSAIIFI